MNQKVCVVLSALVLVSASASAQRPLKMAKKVTEAMTGAVPSAFSSAAPVSFVGGELVGRQIAKAQFAQTNSIYISSVDLFKRVVTLSSMQKLPAAERKALEMKFAQLDLSVKTATNKNLGYMGALWNTSPAVQPQTLQASHVQSMTQLLDIQRYMQLNDQMFPQVFTIHEGGWLQATDCLSSAEGNRAFMGVVDILIKQAQNRVPQAVVDQLVALHVSARNALPVVQVVKQLENWRAIFNDPNGAPQLPKEGGVSLRQNPEALWLATEIRLLQLTPGLELPEVLKTAQVVR